MTAQPYFLVIDCDSFFVSCEQLFRPDLKGKPVVVLSSNDGCVIARSYEAKQLGVPMGAPYFKVKESLQFNNVRFFSSNFKLYGPLSARVTAFIQGQAAGTVEQYSIDEWFVKERTAQRALATAKLLKHGIEVGIGLPVSIGIGRTKTLAKAAVWQAKKKPERIHLLGSEEQELVLLRQLPLQKVWGIGRRLSPNLHSKGLTKAHQLCLLGSSQLRRFGRNSVVFLRTVEELKGVSCIKDNENPYLTSMTRTRTFGNKTTDHTDIESCIASFTTLLTQRLRKKDLVASGAYIFVRSSNNDLNEMSKARQPKFYKQNHTKTTKIFFEEPTNDTLAMIQELSAGLPKILSQGQAYNRAGVVLVGVQPEHQVTATLGKDIMRSKSYQRVQSNKKLWPVMDKLIGLPGAVILGTQLLGSGLWQPRRQWVSDIDLSDPHHLPKVQ